MGRKQLLILSWSVGVVLSLSGILLAQTALSIDDIEGLLRNKVLPVAIAEVVRKEGVQFELDDAFRTRLRQAGATAELRAAIELASADRTRQRLEEAQRKLEELEQQGQTRQAAQDAQEAQETASKAAQERRAAEAEQQRQAAEAEQKQADTARQHRGGPMLPIPAGTLWMGCNDKVDKECDDDEKPGREVQVAAFHIDKTEVTVAAYHSMFKFFLLDICRQL